MSEPFRKPLKEKFRTGDEEVLDLVFRSPTVRYVLQEFPKEFVKEIVVLEKKPGRIYIRCLKRKKEIFIYDKERGTCKPEEVIRQLWLRKLIKEYGYPLDRLEVEKSVVFGREIHTKRADIVLYKEDKITPYIVFELKEPNVKKAEETLKSYLSGLYAEGGIWSNGIQKFILYRPYPKEYVTTLSDIPKVNQTWDDLFKIPKTYNQLSPDFDLSYIIERLEEMVLAQKQSSLYFS